jgi:hypothetical protein
VPFWLEYFGSPFFDVEKNASEHAFNVKW